MLRSLFGDLYPLRDAALARRQARADAETEFAATAVLDPEDSASAQGATGLPLERHTRDLFVAGSPAQAMRAHFASQPDEREGERLITLYDPAQMWASSVIKALSDASGQPIERLHLRDQSTLGTLAMIERTLLPRRHDDTLKIYHADVRAHGRDAQLIPLALMERADLTVVIIGPMHSSAVESMIEALRRACAGDHWRCREMLFLLPVGAHWIEQKVLGTHWPKQMHVQVQSEPLTSASTVWNLLLTHWNRVRPSPAPMQDTDPGVLAEVPAASRPMPLAPATQRDALPTSFGGAANASTGLPVTAAAPAAAARAPHPMSAGTPERAQAVLHELMLLDGLIFAALVNINTGEVVASEGRGPDIDRAASAAAEVLQVHRRTLHQMGHWRSNDPVDEVLVTAGSRYHILRTLQAHPDLFILAVLDKLRSNLAMTRFRVMEAQQVLT